MSIKVLLIEDEAAYAQLLSHHITTEWPDAMIRLHNPAAEGALLPEFVAAAYDVVLLDHDLAGDPGIEWLRDLTQRPGFPPIIFLPPSDDPGVVLPALAAGAEACIGKHKIDHRRLVNAIGEASRKRRRQAALWRGTARMQHLYRFGSVTIRGQRFIRVLATGAISTVFLAESEKAGELVALKVLREIPEHAEGRGAFDRFLLEYEVVAKVEHPNIVRIHDFGIADDHAYIAMEYFSEGDLRTRLKKPLSPAEAVDCMRQIAAALHAIHAVGVLHRDLKPGNVMLRPGGSLALIDFGLAKQLKLDAAITATGEIFGTPYYMSPEQGHGAETDERSDLYSLGVISFEMLTGRKPYLGPTPMAVIYKHNQSPIPELNPDLAYLQPIVHRLLAKSPRDRFQAAGDVIEALDSLALQSATPALRTA